MTSEVWFLAFVVLPVAMFLLGEVVHRRFGTIFLAEGDWLGFLQAIYVASFMSADLFWGFIILLLTSPLYIRTRSLTLLCIVWILLGGGIIVAAPIVAPLGIGLMALGIAGILVKIFTALR